MAAIKLKGMWSLCKCSSHFLRHTKASFSIKSCLISDKFLLSQTFRQLNFAYLSRNVDDNRPCDLLSCSFQKKYLSTCPVYLKNAITKELLSVAMEDIDLEELQEQVERDRKMNHEKVHLVDKLKEQVAKKCDELLANLNPEEEKKLKVIKLEHSFLFSEGYFIPDVEKMTSENWLEALKLSSKSQRLKYYQFVAKRSVKRESQKNKPTVEKEREPGEPTYYEHGRLFMRIYESTMKRWTDYRLAQSMQYGLPLVIDLDYVSHMKSQEIKNTGHQLQDLYVLNRNDPELPFHLHFVNCQQNNPIFRTFQMLQQDDQDFLVTVTEESYLDLFDKKNLVYLSPNGRQVMTEFDPEAVYIIGGFNDKATMQPISYARAKEQKIKCQRLPIDEYVAWNQGSKSLTLNQMIKILLAVKNKKSWREAFSAIPKRKVRNSDI